MSSNEGGGGLLPNKNLSASCECGGIAGACFGIGGLRWAVWSLGD